MAVKELQITIYLRKYKAIFLYIFANRLGGNYR